METRHIKFDYGQTLNAQKQLLSAEINLLHMMRALKTYKILRKKELAEKNKLKTNLGSLKIKIKLVQSTLPKQESKLKPKRKPKGIKKQTKKSLKNELEDIKKKLERLK